MNVEAPVITDVASELLDNTPVGTVFGNSRQSFLKVIFCATQLLTEYVIACIHEPSPLGDAV